jgi:hypothetical protein
MLSFALHHDTTSRTTKNNSEFTESFDVLWQTLATNYAGATASFAGAFSDASAIPGINSTSIQKL